MNKTPDLMTVSRFAHAFGSDRRTVRRRIEANGIQPVGRDGSYPLYHFETLREIMRGPEDAPASPPEHGPRSKDFVTGFEIAKDLAVYSAGEAMPDAVRKALGPKATRTQVDKAAFEVWLAVVARIEADVAGHALPSGSLMNHMIESGEWPEAMAPIVKKMQAETKSPLAR
jgi:hypothetical protein